MLGAIPIPLALALLGAAHGTAGDDETGLAGAPAAASARIVSILRSTRDPEVGPLEDLVASLAQASLEDPDTVFDVLVQRRIPALDGGPEQTLSVPQRELLVEALAALERRPVLEMARGFASRSQTADERAATLRFYAAAARARELREILALASFDGFAARDPVRDALVSSTAQVLRRDLEGIRALEDLWREVPDECVEAIVLAVGRARAVRGLAMLEQILDLRPDLAPLVVPQVRMLDPWATLEPRPILEATLRGYLSTADGNLRPGASLALGALGDYESVPALIALVEEPGLRDNATWALRRLSGLRLAAQRDVWQSWYASEADWWKSAAPVLLGHLRSDDRAVVLAALREIAEHRFRRHQLADEVVHSLHHALPAVRVQACRTLAALGSERAVSELVERLADDHPEVRTQAWSALRRCTGMDLPLDARAWRRQLADIGVLG